MVEVEEVGREGVDSTVGVGGGGGTGVAGGGGTGAARGGRRERWGGGVRARGREGELREPDPARVLAGEPGGVEERLRGIGGTSWRDWTGVPGREGVEVSVRAGSEGAGVEEREGGVEEREGGVEVREGGVEVRDRGEEEGGPSALIGVSGMSWEDEREEGEGAEGEKARGEGVAKLSLRGYTGEMGGWAWRSSTERGGVEAEKELWRTYRGTLLI